MAAPQEERSGSRPSVVPMLDCSTWRRGAAEIGRVRLGAERQTHHDFGVSRIAHRELSAALPVRHEGEHAGQPAARWVAAAAEPAVQGRCAHLLLTRPNSTTEADRGLPLSATVPRAPRFVTSASASTARSRLVACRAQMMSRHSPFPRIPHSWNEQDPPVHLAGFDPAVRFGGLFERQGIGVNVDEALADGSKRAFG